MALAKALESDGATAVLNRMISEQTFHTAGTDTDLNKIYSAPWLDQYPAANHAKTYFIE
jgi:hypothetical protein